MTAVFDQDLDSSVAAAELGSRAAEPLIACQKLRVGYAGSALLPPVDLTIARGELWAVIGRNGSGKSTWLRTLLGLLPPVSGEIRALCPKVRFAYLGQRQIFDDAYPLLVKDVVGMGLERGLKLLPGGRAQRQAHVREALRLVSASELALQPFRELSEGQKQRVLFARLAAGRPDIAVLDEPTSAMDLVAEREAYELLDRLRRETEMAIVIVSHYLGLARQYADRALLLDRDLGEVVVDTPAVVLEHEVFRRQYGDPSLPSVG